METKIRFKKITDTHIKVLFKGQLVGDIWSKISETGLPYSGSDTIQICGITGYTGTWGCGRFPNKDICLHFEEPPKHECICKGCHKKMS